MEFESEGLAASGATLDMTLSENRLPGEVHNLKPKAHNSTYRLEPNNQLYEGVRYLFVNVTAAGSGPWAIKNLRRVCQVVPSNYDGHFSCSDDVLTRIWWTGAYTARVTMVGNGLNSKGAGYLGSELKDRGDRIAFLGDAHATQPTVLAAFGNFELLWHSNEVGLSRSHSLTSHLSPLNSLTSHSVHQEHSERQEHWERHRAVLGDVGALGHRPL